ncbi:IDEAL domain-containing protein [Neobacillus sp. SAB-20_R2A]|uniref:IDEAL domain-containing protein n=1 Tax=Neobacillus sp. SAB-20_R2A TaxID=3120519 RepID=UPI003C6E3D1D
MKKLSCRYCGNKEFYVLSVNETLCKCGMRLKKFSDYHTERDAKWEQLFRKEQKRKAELISKISLLTREIDSCLDNRDESRFQELTEELKTCWRALHIGRNHSEKV